MLQAGIHDLDILWYYPICIAAVTSAAGFDAEARCCTPVINHPSPAGFASIDCRLDVRSFIRAVL